MSEGAAVMLLFFAFAFANEVSDKYPGVAWLVVILALMLFAGFLEG